MVMSPARHAQRAARIKTANCPASIVSLSFVFAAIVGSLPRPPSALPHPLHPPFPRIAFPLISIVLIGSDKPQGGHLRGCVH